MGWGARPRHTGEHTVSDGTDPQLMSQFDSEVDLHLASPAATVVIGQPDELPAKMVALSTILTRVDLRELGMIDLRVPGAPVLTRDGAKK